MNKSLHITESGKLLAIYIPSNFERGPGISFLTGDSSEFQLGLMRREQGYVIPEHTHQPIRRETNHTSEFLWIREGRVKVSLRHEGKTRELIMESGDAILFFGGTHGFEMLEDSEILEVKQGPYLGREIDKE